MIKLGTLLKWGILIKGVVFERVAEEVCSYMFLQQAREAESSEWKFNEITKIIILVGVLYRKSDIDF